MKQEIPFKQPGRRSIRPFFMIKRYNFRAYPNKKQQEYFQQVFGQCRFVYNWALDLKDIVLKGIYSPLRYQTSLWHIVKEIVLKGIYSLITGRKLKVNL